MKTWAVVNLLGRGLDAAALRHRVLANNIANVNTPGFKRSDVSFQREFFRALQTDRIPVRTTHPDHIGGWPTGLQTVEAVLRTEPSSSYRNDGNNVDIDAEMSYLAQNTLFYLALTRVLGSKFDILKTAVTGRGR